MNVLIAEEIFERLHEAVYDFGCNEYVSELCWYQNELDKYYAYQSDGEDYEIKFYCGG